jgi:hypothetical protein
MPTAVVDGAIMSEVADEIAAAAEDIEESEIFEQILDVITEVEEELETAISRTCNGGENGGKTCNVDADCPGGACDGSPALVLGGACDGGANEGERCASDGDCPDGTCKGGVTLPSPTGAVKIDYICPGHEPEQFDPDYLKTCKDGTNDGSACTDDADCPEGTCVEGRPDSGNGSIDLNITLDGGGIGRVAWGTARNCEYLIPSEGDDCEAAACIRGSFDGGVAVDLGPDWVGQVVEELPVTFVVEGNIGLDDEEPFRINQSFRLVEGVESGLVILVDISDPALSEPPLSETFNYIFAGERQLIRDGNGVFGCSLEDSECFELACEGGGNEGNPCTINAECPEGRCEQVEPPLFSW